MSNAKEVGDDGPSGNPGGFTDGEMILVCGGPADGDTFPVNVVNLGTNQRVRSIKIVKTDHFKHKYTLSVKRRKWMHCNVEKMK